MNASPEIWPAIWPAFDAIRFFERTRGHGHSAMVGIDYVSQGEDWIELSLKWRADLVGVAGDGLIATGAIVSLMDMAGSLAVWKARNEFRPMATLDLRIDYLRPAPTQQTIFGRGRSVKLTKSVAFAEAIAHVGKIEEPVARAVLTFMPI